MRPPPPVPTIMAAVSPCSRSRRRTAGVMRASALPGISCEPRSSDPAGPCATGAADAIGDAAAALEAWDEAESGAGAASADEADAAAGAGAGAAAGPGAASAAAGVAADAAGAGCGVAAWSASAVDAVDAGAAAAATVAAPASSITAISALFGTVAPSSTRISFRTPSYGDGTSALTLSVMTSSSGSYLATWSPGCFSHLPIVPSATLSPSWGIVTFATGSDPPMYGP